MKNDTLILQSIVEFTLVVACACGLPVIREDDWYVMFYIGFADEHTAQIGIAAG